MGRVRKHPRFGPVCMCDCHKDGTDIREFMPCCMLYRAKYINADGTLDEERLLAIYEERGIPLWTWRDHLRSWWRGTWIFKRWDRWMWFRRLRRFRMPAIRKAYPCLNADDIVSTQPMAVPVVGVGFGASGTIKKSHVREDGVRVIDDFDLKTVSIVSEDQLLDPRCAIEYGEEDGRQK